MNFDRGSGPYPNSEDTWQKHSEMDKNGAQREMCQVHLTAHHNIRLCLEHQGWDDTLSTGTRAEGLRSSVNACLRIRILRSHHTVCSTHSTTTSPVFGRLSLISLDLLVPKLCEFGLHLKAGYSDAKSHAVHPDYTQPKYVVSYQGPPPSSWTRTGCFDW